MEWHKSLVRGQLINGGIQEAEKEGTSQVGSQVLEGH